MPNTDNINHVLKALRHELELQNEGHEHSHFDMNDWVTNITDGSHEFEKLPTLCKTTACVAGTAAMVLAPDRVFKWVPPQESDGYWKVDVDSSWETLGAELLGLEHYMAYALFRKDYWPDELWGDRKSDLEQAIYLLEEIRDERLTYENDKWVHPDIEDEPEYCDTCGQRVDDF